MPFGQREPKGYHGYDRRRAVRWQANHPGALILADGRTMNCVIRDFSSSGARLEVLSTFGLCEELVLKFSGHRQWVKVAWSGRHQLGVQFV